MLDTVLNQGLRLCLGAFRASPVESLHVDAHEPSMLPRSNHCLNITYDAVFDNQYMKLCDARPNAIFTFGLHIKQFF